MYWIDESGKPTSFHPCLLNVNGEASMYVCTFERWLRCVKETEVGAAACHDRLQTALH